MIKLLHTCEQDMALQMKKLPEQSLYVYQTFR